MNFQNNKIVSDIDLAEISSMACVVGSGKIGKKVRKMARGSKVFSSPFAPLGANGLVKTTMSDEEKKNLYYFILRDQNYT